MSYELEVVHPATAKWLTENGYAYRHEVVTDAGIIDFLATHQDGHYLIVECKSSSSSHLVTVRQVLDYQREMGNSHRVAISLPKDKISQVMLDNCKRRGISIIGLDVVSKKIHDSDSNERHFEKIIAFIVSVEMHLMVKHHTQNDTVAGQDFIILMDLIETLPLSNREEIKQSVLNGFHEYSRENVGSRVANEPYFNEARIMLFVFRIMGN